MAPSRGPLCNPSKYTIMKFSVKFSVIIPVYNKANTIRDSLNSIFEQSVRDFEIILVDDGSTDNLLEILADYSGLRVIHQKNAGVSAARNTGIQNASGEFICFLDADDTWMPNHLEVLQNLILTHPDKNFYLTSHEISYPDGRCEKTSDYLKPFESIFECNDLIGLLNKSSYCIIQTNSVCIRKEALLGEDIWFVPGARIGEDTDVWYRVSLKHPVVITKEITTLYRREFSTATQASTYSDQWPFYLRKDALLQNPDIPAEAKLSLTELFDRFGLTGAREAALHSDKQKARQLLCGIYNKHGKRYWMTRLFCCLPNWLCRIVYPIVMHSKPI